MISSSIALVSVEQWLRYRRHSIEPPKSPSAMFQDCLRQKIVEQKEQPEVKVIDLASLLRERYRRDCVRFYHPHKGHLNPEGHRVVADILANRIYDTSIIIDQPGF